MAYIIRKSNTFSLVFEVEGEIVENRAGNDDLLRGLELRFDALPQDQKSRLPSSEDVFYIGINWDYSLLYRKTRILRHSDIVKIGVTVTHFRWV